MLNQLLTRIRNVPGNEPGQCFIVRPTAISIVLIYTWWMHSDNSELILVALYMFFTINIINIFIIVWMLRKQDVSPPRYILAIVVDSISTSYIIHINGEYGVALYPIYLWIAFGHGLRYGRFYLLTCASISAVGFFFVYLYQPFWREHNYIFAWFFAAVFLVPWYGSIFLKKLEIALQKSEAANEAKQFFLGKMSHELRTPLNGVMVANDILELSKNLDAEERECVDIIHTSSQNLLELIDNVLDFTNIESGKIKIVYSAVNIIELLDNTVKLFKKGQKISYTTLDNAPTYIVSDKSHLQHVLVNLISNAIKFSNDGTTQITLSSKDDSLIIEIADEGCGIPKDQLQAIFKVFNQANNSFTRDYDGAGLGLSIANQLVTLLGGEIQVHSEPHKGSIFTIILPIQIERQPENPKHVEIELNPAETRL